MSPETVLRVARRLNGGRARGASLALASAMGVPVKTARAWMTNDADNHRRPSRTAGRLLSLLCLLDAGGLLTPEFLRSLETFEELLEGPPRRLTALLAALQPEDDDDLEEEE